ncbi:MAG: hypothetical protein JKY56_25250 [Kofleriaceae bacterium]|nr:hypothetical protein [Kofleriaceae bacterium]
MSDDVGSLLLRAGMIAPQQLEEARSAAKKNGGTVPEQLIQQGELDDEELTRFYCRQLLIPRINPSQLAKLPPHLLEKLPADMASEFRSIPAMMDTDGNLTLVMSDPSDIKAADEIGFFTGSYIVRAIATQAQIAWCLAHYYNQVTPLHKQLISSGQWPRDSGPRVSDKPTPNKKPKEREDSDQISTGPLAREKREVKLGTARRRSRRRAAVPRRPTNQQPSPPELIARAGEIISRGSERDRRVSMQPAVVISSDDSQPSIVISIESDAIPESIEKGTDTSPFLLNSDTLKTIGEDDSSSKAKRSATPPLGSNPEPILLKAKGKTMRRMARDTFTGVGSLGSDGSITPWEKALAQHATARDPLRDTIQMKPIRFGSDDSTANERLDDGDRDGEKTNPEKFVVKLPKTDTPDTLSTSQSLDDMDGDDDWGLPDDTVLPMPIGESNSIPHSVDDEATIKMTPILPMDRADTSDSSMDRADTSDSSMDDLPGAAVEQSPAVEQAVERASITEQPQVVDPLPGVVASEATVDVSAGIASKVLGALRTIDRANDKGDVVEALLDFLDLAFGRCGFLTLRKQELTPWRLHGCSDDASTSIDVSEDSALTDVIQMHLPYSGKINDDSSKQLANDLEYPEARNILLLPMMVKGRVLGVLFGLSVQDRLFEEHVAVLAEAASEAFERIILSSRD